MREKEAKVDVAMSRLRAARLTRRTALQAAGILAAQASLLMPAVGQTVYAATKNGATTPAPIALGVTLREGGQYVNTSTKLLDIYAQQVGAMPAIVNVGSDWANYPNFDPAVMNAIRVRGAMPMYTWLPDNYNQANSEPQPVYSLANIINRHFDSYIWQFALAAKAWGHPFFLRFAHEMNGNWYPWGTGAGNPNHNTPAQFIAAWRHVHDIFKLAGATNVIWVWCVNTGYPGSTPISQDYPGNAYVDWVALDGFNWGNTPGHHWQSLAQVFGPIYSEVTKLTNKPLMIAETGSSEVGGNKANWITQGFIHDLPRKLPRVRAVMWFNEDLLAGLTVDSSAAALAAYRMVAASSLFQARVITVSGVTTICGAQSSASQSPACPSVPPSPSSQTPKK
jgi:hypothetical protein